MMGVVGISMMGVVGSCQDDGVVGSSQYDGGSWNQYDGGSWKLSGRWGSWKQSG